MRALLFVFVSLAVCAAGVAREVELLSQGWTFRYGWNFANAKWTPVTVPHTWNTTDNPSDYPYTRTLGLYTCAFHLNPAWEGKRIFLRFNGASVIADTLLNDVWLGQHRGGYTAFCYEITDTVKFGKENHLRVRVSNAETSDVIPLTGDFNIFGGLYRPVELIATDPVCISPLDMGSSGVTIRQESLTDARATLSVRVKLLNPTREEQTVSVTVDGCTFEGQGIDEVTIPLEISNPHRWHGVEDPYLYPVEICVGGDRITKQIGLRTIEVDANGGLKLNGKPYQVRGVCRHQEWETKLNALSLADHVRDLEILREMGANAVRLAHYPQAKEVYERCDRAGLLVWAEIPFVGPGGYDDEGYIPSERLHENARQQLQEMIRQNINHPSIIVWGLFNELRMAPDPTPFLKELHTLAKQEDPTRLTTAASNLSADASLTFVTDLIAWNRYDGWYGGMPDRLGRFLDGVHATYPHLRIAVSEYGAGASVAHHEETIRKSNPGAMWHPEAWQTQYHILNWIELSKRDYLWGTFIWNLFDFSASHRTEGDRKGVNDKGLVTHDRRTYKDAFYFYKANWRTDTPVLHLCEKRFTRRKADAVFVRAFCNAGPVELVVNGASQGWATPDDLSIVTWERVPLQPGDNTVEVRAKEGSLTDSCTWTYTP